MVVSCCKRSNPSSQCSSRWDNRNNKLLVPFNPIAIPSGEFQLLKLIYGNSTFLRTLYVRNFWLTPKNTQIMIPKKGPKHGFGVSVRNYINLNHNSIEKKNLRTLLLLSSILKVVMSVFRGLLFNKIHFIVLLKLMSLKFKRWLNISSDLSVLKILLSRGTSAYVTWSYVRKICILSYKI